MTSPDFSQYIDLTPLDHNPAEIYLGAIELARLTMPEFSLRQGTPEDAIFQAAAWITALNTGAINRLPSRLMVGMAELLGYPKFQGTRATVEATITLVDYDAAIIPQGTVFAFRYEDSSGEFTQFAFELVDAIDIAAGTPPTLPTGTASLRSMIPGRLPDLPVGTELIVVTTDTTIDSAITTDTYINGQDPDNDYDYLSAITTYMQSLSSNIATTSQAQASILSNFRDVWRCKVYDLTNPTAALLVGDADEPGYMTTFVYGKSRQMTGAERATIQAYLDNKMTASVTNDVLEFTLCGLSVKVNFVYDNSYSQAAIEDAINIIIQDYLSPDSFPLYETSIRSTSIIGRIMQIDGVLYVNSLYLQPVGTNFSQKQWTDVRVATTANITIATALNAGDVLDGITLVAGDRVLVKDQSTGSQNGIYVVSASPTRATDADATGEFAQNKIVYVSVGSSNAGTYWRQTTSGSITVGTTAIAFASTTPYEQLDFVYKGSLPDISLGSVSLTSAGETI